MHGQPEIIAFEAHHAGGVIAVVRAVYDEYGFTWDDSPYFADLRDVARHYHDADGMFWVMIDGGRVIGTVGVTPHEGEQALPPETRRVVQSLARESTLPPASRMCELHRLYLLSAYRGRKLGLALLRTTLEWARQRGYRRMIAWSDVKLTRAHPLYLANGFRRIGERICDDPDKSREYGFLNVINDG